MDETKTVEEKLWEMAKASPTPISSLLSLQFAEHMDDVDSLKAFRGEFIFPKCNATLFKEITMGRKESIYLCGNSLGLQPKNTRELIFTQLDKWGAEGVEGHFTGETQWLDIDDLVSDSMAAVVGAKKEEVVMMNSLTCNLHLMMISFYAPIPTRHKILIEKKSFPSDYHAVCSQIQLHGYDPATSLIEIGPRDDETHIREEDIIDLIDKEKESLSLVLLSGVQYYTGQFFDIQAVTAAARRAQCYIGWDLAHAVGNVPLHLHDWECDFACWCSYKYLNCGPGSIGGCFVHEKHGKGQSDKIDGTANSTTSATITSSSSTIADKPTHIRRLQGWWGYNRESRFKMDNDLFVPCSGVNGFRLSNPPVLLIAGARASLDLFDQADMTRLRAKSLLLTGYLQHLLQTEMNHCIDIFTPLSEQSRGCQLSISVGEELLSTLKMDMDDIVKTLKQAGVICDARKPNTMRVAPAPLYNSFVDVYLFVKILKAVLTSA